MHNEGNEVSPQAICRTLYNLINFARLVAIRLIPSCKGVFSLLYGVDDDDDDRPSFAGNQKVNMSIQC